MEAKLFIVFLDRISIHGYTNRMEKNDRVYIGVENAGSSTIV